MSHSAHRDSLPLTCGLDAFRPFPIEGAGCPEVNSWLSSGHDTVKGLPKGKARTQGQPQVFSHHLPLPLCPHPLPEACLLPPLSKQDESQGSGRHQGCQHTQDHRHPGCAAVGRALLACGRHGHEAG